MFKVKLIDGTFASFASYETALAVSAKLAGKHGKPSKYSARRCDDGRQPVGMIVWDHAQAN